LWADKIEEAKKNLSVNEGTVLSLPYTDKMAQNLDLKRKHMEEATSEACSKIKELIETALKNRGIEPEQIALVVKTGGMTKVPVISSLIEVCLPFSEHVQTKSNAKCVGASLVAQELDNISEL
jgi:molecular chaperone DnaK (HSP70)